MARAFWSMTKQSSVHVWHWLLQPHKWCATGWHCWVSVRRRKC